MQNWEDTLIDYLENQLSVEQRLDVEKALANSKELQGQLAELKTILTGLDQLPEFQPRERLKNNFQEYLEKFEAKELDSKQETPVVSIWSKYRFAIQSLAAAVVLAFGIFIGQKMGTKQNTEISEVKIELEKMKMAMMVMMQKESVSDRIKAVNISYDMNTSTADDEIIEAMINRMNHDESDNVRLAAAEALSRWAKEPKVQNALIDALNSQSDPFIQIALINILVELKETRAVKSLEELINNYETKKFVKDEAQMGIFKLTSI